MSCTTDKLLTPELIDSGSTSLTFDIVNRFAPRTNKRTPRERIICNLSGGML